MAFGQSPASQNWAAGPGLSALRHSAHPSIPSMTSFRDRRVLPSLLHGKCPKGQENGKKAEKMKKSEEFSQKVGNSVDKI